MKAKELRDMTVEELQKKMNDTKDELFRLRFQLATGQLDNPMRIKEVRRNIARVKTVIREREIGIKRA
ncbi:MULTISPECIES: 50S ribosomal protein L29 [Desulfallaceae]|uniref:Large ribosomal subunit protein uL29 n=2 Tax=Desulfallaceae TaxID=2867375 RepID=A0A9D2WPJ7_9FIRM|nr:MULTISPECIES: 50S ribosomal protein L29 [Desulfallaceae]AGK99950.1 ribosomal protein L29 [Desulfoscipio gibsoniae DSM 7213]KAF1085215.1 50S ribosomal protein L29 [Sporotomaculum syntrophicum]